MARDNYVPRVVLLSDDASLRERWRIELANLATIVADQAARGVDAAALIADVLVTDSSSAAQSLVKEPRGIIFIGEATDVTADVQLSSHYQARELQLVLHLVGSLARLREGHSFMTYAVQETAKQARIDFVTGLLNRAAWETQRQALTKRHLPACVALLDLDNFKACNDRVNWTFGDTVLRTVAGVISQSLQKQDIAARWGGDEFAILFSKTSPEEVAPRIEQLRSEIAALRFAEHPEVTISASVGYASLSSADEFGAAFIACQTALREAKLVGGNAARLINPS